MRRSSAMFVASTLGSHAEPGGALTPSTRRGRAARAVGALDAHVAHLRPATAGRERQQRQHCHATPQNGARQASTDSRLVPHATRTMTPPPWVATTASPTVYRTTVTAPSRSGHRRIGDVAPMLTLRPRSDDNTTARRSGSTTEHLGAAHGWRAASPRGVGAGSQLGAPMRMMCAAQRSRGSAATTEELAPRSRWCEQSNLEGSGLNKRSRAQRAGGDGKLNDLAPRVARVPSDRDSCS